MKRAQGFTLVEMLVALAVAGVIIAVILQYFVTSVPITAKAGASARESRELQNAASVIADDIRQATYILEPNHGAAINTTIAIGAPSTTGTKLIAMTVPVQPGSDCTVQEFVAYYVAPRSGYVGGDEWVDPGPDPHNDSADVLMQYRGCASEAGPSATITNPDIRIVADYIDFAEFTYDPGDVRSVTIALRARRVIRGSTLYTPSESGTVTLSAYARNIE